MGVNGTRRLMKRLRALSSIQADRAIGEGLFAAGQLIEVDAAISISEGAVSGKHHQPSAPGQPPNENTGLLSRNINTVQVSPREVRVVSTAPYSADLELGTSKMAARAFMSPAVQRNRREAVETVRRSLKAGIRRAMRSKG